VSGAEKTLTGGATGLGIGCREPENLALILGTLEDGAVLGVGATFSGSFLGVKDPLQNSVKEESIRRAFGRYMEKILWSWPGTTFDSTLDLEVIVSLDFESRHKLCTTTHIIALYPIAIELFIFERNCGERR
jgi:hypothetical protein